MAERPAAVVTVSAQAAGAGCCSPNTAGAPPHQGRRGCSRPFTEDEQLGHASGPESKQSDLLAIHSPNVMAGKLGHANNQTQDESSGALSLIAEMENTNRNVISPSIVSWRVPAVFGV